MRAWSASLFFEQANGFRALVLMPLARQTGFDVTSTQTLFAKQRAAESSELLIGRPQARFAGGRRSADFVITSDKERRLGTVPLFIAQNTIVIVANTERLVPEKGLIEVIVAKVVGIHDLGI
jgi:hypothetical protein